MIQPGSMVWYLLLVIVAVSIVGLGLLFRRNHK